MKEVEYRDGLLWVEVDTVGTHERIAFAASIANDILYYTVDDREIWAARPRP